MPGFIVAMAIRACLGAHYADRIGNLRGTLPANGREGDLRAGIQTAMVVEIRPAPDRAPRNNQGCQSEGKGKG